jgi:hypothetical protein
MMDTNYLSFACAEIIKLPLSPGAAAAADERYQTISLVDFGGGARLNL